MEKNPSDTNGRNKKNTDCFQVCWLVCLYCSWDSAGVEQNTQGFVDKSPLVQRWLTEQVTPLTTSFKMVQLFVMKAVWITNKSLTLQCWEEGTLFLLLLPFSAVRYLLVQSFVLFFYLSQKILWSDFKVTGIHLLYLTRLCSTGLHFKFYFYWHNSICSLATSSHVWMLAKLPPSCIVHTHTFQTTGYNYNV